MIVTVSGASGLRNAYVSVLSAEGSSEINGASRWLEAWAVAGLPPRDVSAATSAARAAAARSRTASLRIVLHAPFRRPVGFAVLAVVSALIRLPGPTGSDRTESSPTANRGDERNSSASGPVLCTSVRRGGRRPACALGRVGTRRALRQVRPGGIRACSANPPGRQTRGRCRAGRFPHRVAQRRPFHAGAREGQHLVTDARPPSRRRSRAPRGPAARGAAQRDRRAGGVRLCGGRCMAPL